MACVSRRICLIGKCYFRRLRKAKFLPEMGIADRIKGATIRGQLP
jgi:hypothetical protein